MFLRILYFILSRNSCTYFSSIQNFHININKIFMLSVSSRIQIQIQKNNIIMIIINIRLSLLFIELLFIFLIGQLFAYTKIFSVECHTTIKEFKFWKLPRNIISKSIHRVFDAFWVLLSEHTNTHILFINVFWFIKNWNYIKTRQYTYNMYCWRLNRVLII